MWPLYKTTKKSDERKKDVWGRGGVPNSCEREKRKEGEIITHRATCKTKYHLFVCKHEYKSIQ